MRYVTHYEEYPIYEPAEGGYYYSGNQITETERMSKRAAKATMRKFWEMAKAENLAEFGSEEPEDYDQYGNRNYPWRISSDGNTIWKGGKYIGEGESYVLERKLGSEKRGYVPYC